MSKLLVLRIVAVLVWTVAVFQVWGGQYLYRRDLPDGRWNSYSLSMYWWLPPEQAPKNCRFLDVPPVSLALPCDLRPPILGWLRERYFR